MTARVDLERLDETAEDLSAWPDQEHAAREAVRPLASGVHITLAPRSRPPADHARENARRNA